MTEPDSNTDTVTPCQGCLEKNTQIDNLTTQVTNMAATLAQVVDAVNTVGAQQQWMVSTVDSTFRNMQETLAKGGIRGILGMVSGGNGG